MKVSKRKLKFQYKCTEPTTRILSR
uniref:Uncharacterized protein n=1 Tax=Arundo donax TaxID=35708 RepID=A0A0A8YE52_ARUDO